MNTPLPLYPLPCLEFRRDFRTVFRPEPSGLIDLILDNLRLLNLPPFRFARNDSSVWVKRMRVPSRFQPAEFR